MTEKDCLIKFAERLNRILINHNITQHELSERTGLTEATISRYCNANRLPNMYNLIKISNALSYSTDYLCGLNMFDEFEMAGFSEEECVELRKLSEKYNIEPGVLIHAVQYMGAGTKKYTAIDKLLEMSGG